MACLEAGADQGTLLLLTCSVVESPGIIRCTMSFLKGPLSQVMTANGAESLSLVPILRSPGSPSAPAADRAVPRASFIQELLQSALVPEGAAFFHFQGSRQIQSGKTASCRRCTYRLICTHSLSGFLLNYKPAAVDGFGLR